MNKNQMHAATKRQAHFQAFGYEPLRMKPAHFASGFFAAITGKEFENKLLNYIAVIKANKGLLESYKPKEVEKRLKADKLTLEKMTQSDIELLRVQINGVVNNDGAMYPAFSPYQPKGNDYTFLSQRLLTYGNRTDGYAGFFVASVLRATNDGKRILETGRILATEPHGTLEHLIEPLLNEEINVELQIDQDYEKKFGNKLSLNRLANEAKKMEKETAGLMRLCNNSEKCSHYNRIRFYVLGLLAWLMNYLTKTAQVKPNKMPIIFFDFSGKKKSHTRLLSQECYSHLRTTIGNFYRLLPDIENHLFKKRHKNQVLSEDYDFTFLETHFSDLALRMGYAQPRASQVKGKHLELQPDTLRTLMLSVLPKDPNEAITFENLCDCLSNTWGVVVGGRHQDVSTLREHGYHEYDEEDLRENAAAFVALLKSLNLAIEPSDGLVLCSIDAGGMF